MEGRKPPKRKISKADKRSTLSKKAPKKLSAKPKVKKKVISHKKKSEAKPKVDKLTLAKEKLSKVKRDGAKKEKKAKGRVYRSIRERSKWPLIIGSFFIVALSIWAYVYHLGGNTRLLANNLKKFRLPSEITDLKNLTLEAAEIPAPIDLYRARSDAYLIAIINSGKEIIPTLIEKFSQMTDNEKIATVVVLGEFKSFDALEIFIEAMQSKNKILALFACRAAGSMENSAVQPLLDKFKQLKEENYLFLEAITRIQTQEALTALLSLTKSSHAKTRLTAIRKIGLFREKLQEKAFDELFKIIKKDKSKEVVDEVIFDLFYKLPSGKAQEKNRKKILSVAKEEFFREKSSEKRAQYLFTIAILGTNQDLFESSFDNFDLNRSYLSYLKSQEIKPLKNEFQKRGYLLSNNLDLSKKGNVWVLKDQTNHQRYIFELAIDRIHIYHAFKNKLRAILKKQEQSKIYEIIACGYTGCKLGFFHSKEKSLAIKKLIMLLPQAKLHKEKLVFALKNLSSTKVIREFLKTSFFKSSKKHIYSSISEIFKHHYVEIIENQELKKEAIIFLTKSLKNASNYNYTQECDFLTESLSYYSLDKLFVLLETSPQILKSVARALKKLDKPNIIIPKLLEKSKTSIKQGTLLEIAKIFEHYEPYLNLQSRTKPIKQFFTLEEKLSFIHRIQTLLKKAPKKAGKEFKKIISIYEKTAKKVSKAYKNRSLSGK